MAECTPQPTSTVLSTELFTSLVPSTSVSTETRPTSFVSTSLELVPVSVVSNGSTTVLTSTRTSVVTVSSLQFNPVTITQTQTSTGTRTVAVETLFSSCPSIAPSSSSAVPPTSTTSSRPPTISSAPPSSLIRSSTSSTTISSAVPSSSSASSSASTSVSASSAVADEPSSSFTTTTVYWTSYVYTDGRTSGMLVASGKALARTTHKSNPGAIAGGVVGGVLALVLLVTGLFLLLRRKKSKNRQSKAFTSRDIFNPDNANKPLPTAPMEEKRTSKRLSFLGGAGAGASAAAAGRRKSGAGLWGDESADEYPRRDHSQSADYDDSSEFGGGTIEPYSYTSHSAPSSTPPPLGPFAQPGQSSPSPSFDRRQSYLHPNHPNGPTSPRLHAPQLSPRPEAYAHAPVWGSGYIGSGGGSHHASSSGHGHNPSYSQQYSPSAGPVGGLPPSTSLASVKAAEAEAARAAADDGRGLMVHEDGGRAPEGDAPPPQYN